MHLAVQRELDISATFIQRYDNDIVIAGLLQHVADHASDAFCSAARRDVIDEEGYVGLSHGVPPGDRKVAVVPPRA